METSLYKLVIIFHYDIFIHKIKYQNITTSNLRFSFTMSKCDDYLKHVNVQQFWNDQRNSGKKVYNELSVYI